MSVTYHAGTASNAQEVAELYRLAGLRRPIDDLARIQRMLDGADLTFCARDGETLVGIARAITDHAYCCYLSDLAVHPNYQRMGLGRALVAQVQAAVGDEVMVLLLAAPQARDYYAHIGFDKVENAWQLPRRR